MKKTRFAKALKEFREESTGAACLIDPVTEEPHCAPGLTEAQANLFAQKHHLHLISWQKGKNCLEAGCGG